MLTNRIRTRYLAVAATLIACSLAPGTAQARPTAHAPDGQASPLAVQVGPCVLHAYLPMFSGGWVAGHGAVDTCGGGNVHSLEIEVCVQVANGSSWFTRAGSCQDYGVEFNVSRLDSPGIPFPGTHPRTYRTWDWTHVCASSSRCWSATYASSGRAF